MTTSGQPLPLPPLAGLKVTAMAGEVVDRFTDETAPVEEQQKRKRKLIHGPREFRDVRQDQHRLGADPSWAESQAMTPRPKRKSQNAKRSVVIGQQKTRQPRHPGSAARHPNFSHSTLAGILATDISGWATWSSNCPAFCSSPSDIVSSWTIAG